MSDFVSPDSDEAKSAAKGLESGSRQGSRFKHNLSHEQILRFAARRGFTVSRQYRQDALRAKASKLASRGLLSGGRGKRFGDGHSYSITPLGLAVLKLLESKRVTKEEAKA